MTVDRIARDAFGAMAQEYERGRPGWPADAIAALLERFGARTVLDLAAGTGKLTELLAARAEEVVAVEPVDGMRAVLAARLPGVRALAGSAEAIPLPDASVDIAFVAEAFHWFDPEPAASELARVVRPGGAVVVLWNVSAGEDPPWVDEVFEVVRDQEVDHEHRTNRDRMVAMIASFSAIGSLPEDRRAAALDAVRDVLERHGVVETTLRFRTLITTAERVDG